MSSALSCPAPWKGEKEDKGVAHAHAEGRGVHEKTRTCAVSISLHPARCVSCDLPTPAASPLVSVTHYQCPPAPFLLLFLLWAIIFGIARKEDNL